MTTVVAVFPDAAAEGWARVREVLDLVLAPPQTWPSLDEWARILPAWFVSQCTDDVQVQNCVIDKWSLRAWVWWFQPEQRRWTLSRARIDGDQVVVDLEPTGQGSLLLGALEWLVKCGGGRLLAAD